MVLIQDLEYIVGEAVKNTIGSDLMLALLVLLIFAGAAMMFRLTLEASAVILIPAIIGVVYVAGLSPVSVFLLGIPAAAILYLAYTKLVNR